MFSFDASKPFLVNVEIRVHVTQDESPPGGEVRQAGEDIGANPSRSRTRIPGLLITPQEFYFDPIIVVLGRSGGTMTTDDACDAVASLVGSSLTDDDHLSVPSGPEPRWRNNVRWARKKMLGTYLERETPRGIWTLSTEGLARFARINQEWT